MNILQLIKGITLSILQLTHIHKTFKNFGDRQNENERGAPQKHLDSYLTELRNLARNLALKEFSAEMVNEKIRMYRILKYLINIEFEGFFKYISIMFKRLE